MAKASRRKIAKKKVFEPFWRKSDEIPGAGLGLTIAEEIVTLHGGSISIAETPGGGATFEVVPPRLDRTRESSPQGEIFCKA